MSAPENCASTSSATAYAMEGGREKLPCLSLQKFTLYQTRSKFYMIGKDKNSDKNSSRLRVLKIDRLEPSDLIIEEDPCIYDANECKALLSALHDGNLSTGGLMSVTKCYGIVGFIKFLEPYYMILITKRRKIGTICGHTIYGISESRIIPVAHSTILTKLAYSKDEQRYKKLLSMVDLTKDFFFSYTYQIMWSLQRNLTEGGTGQTIYERLFVWNEFLTRSIRQMLNNTHWTVALVYGFLKQAKIPLNGRSLWLTLIARRSRHYAGTRYLKRGVNDKGRVANDVETEQIVFEDESGQIASVVQNRGSIPLYWSQEASRFNLRPDIIFHNKDPEYRATKLHFRNLSLRYGNPIIVLNLIKTKERKPRECTLGKEFAKAIEFINDKLPEEDQLKYIQWDFSLNFRRNSINVLAELEKWALWALDFTGFFYSKITPELIADPEHGKNDRDESKQNMYSSKLKCDGSTDNKPLLQRGVLRTNCIDCLDRTNVAQYAYGLAVLGHQLCSLGLTDNPKIDPDSSVGEELMGLYEKMGDTLAMQYGGSAAHNKVFSLKRGRWLAMAQSQEFFRTLQRYYRNAYLDAEKQDAINVFLGHFQPHQGKPALWELDSDQHCNIGRPIDVVDSTVVGTFIRSFSEGNVLSHTSDSIKESHLPLGKDNMSLEVEHPEMTPCGAELPTDEEPFLRSLQSAARRQLFHDWKSIESLQENAEKTRETNLIDIDWLASSGNSCEEDSVERFPSRGHLERGSSEDYTADVEEVDEDSNQATEDIAKLAGSEWSEEIRR